MKNIGFAAIVTLLIVSCKETGEPCEESIDCIQRCCGCDDAFECKNGFCTETGKTMCINHECCFSVFGCDSECSVANPHEFTGECGDEICPKLSKLYDDLGCCTTQPDTDFWMIENACGFDGVLMNMELLGRCVQVNQPGSHSQQCSDIELEYEGNTKSFTGCCSSENICSYEYPPFGCARWSVLRSEFGLNTQPIECVFEE